MKMSEVLSFLSANSVVIFAAGGASAVIAYALTLCHCRHCDSALKTKFQSQETQPQGRETYVGGSKACSVTTRSVPFEDLL